MDALIRLYDRDDAEKLAAVTRSRGIGWWLEAARWRKMCRFLVSMEGNGRSGKSTADRIKLSATARDIPSEPPRKSLESFREGSFFRYFCILYLLIHALSRQRLSIITSNLLSFLDFDYRYWHALLIYWCRRIRDNTVAHSNQFYFQKWQIFIGMINLIF